MGPFHTDRATKKRTFSGLCKLFFFLASVLVFDTKNLEPEAETESFVKQEKRKKSNILPNGLVEGEEEDEHDGHGGPELQRTGR